MLKKFLVIGAAVAMVSAISITAYAGSWKQDATGWWWQNDDGSYPVSKWEWLDGNNDGVAESYCFDARGYMYADTVTPDNYTVNKDGQWTVNGVVQTKNVGVSDGVGTQAPAEQTQTSGKKGGSPADYGITDAQAQEVVSFFNTNHRWRASYSRSGQVQSLKHFGFSDGQAQYLVDTYDFRGACVKDAIETQCEVRSSLRAMPNVEDSLYTQEDVEWIIANIPESVFLNTAENYYAMERVFNDDAYAHNKLVNEDGFTEAEYEYGKQKYLEMLAL